MLLLKLYIIKMYYKNIVLNKIIISIFIYFYLNKIKKKIYIKRYLN